MKRPSALYAVGGTGLAVGHPALDELRARIVEAAAVAWAAGIAYHNREPRSLYLHKAANRAHRELLAQIAELTPDEADELEPAFTAFEDNLLHLPTPGSTLHPSNDTGGMVA
jgi:hypothetical protein